MLEKKQISEEDTTQFNEQLKFIQHAMAPDVACSAGFGQEAIMKNWRLTQFFGDVLVELDDMQTSSDSLVSAVTRTSVTITRRTFGTLLPHLNNPDIGSNEYKLASKLLGQRIVMLGSAHFEWDDVHGLLASVMFQNDMLTPLLCLLGDLEEVALVFDKAAVSPEFQWKTRM
ncbi:unnamed protein product [Phytophthora lilii]|uniref:Unnamed protein product n=1 Tax=Phytophthora lilii TaxID=2077276 RepID=A0A9W6WUP6_9STRA|nr:unnamed protein product [Phytophthora lilii]